MSNEHRRQVDELINNKPWVTVIAERYKSQMETAHFRHLLEAEVLEIDHDAAGRVDIMERLTRGEDQKVEERAQFLIDFIDQLAITPSVGAR